VEAEKGKRGRGASGKIPVFGMLKRGAKFFSSNTFTKLSDTENKLYEKDWTEIYQLLLNELKLQS